jgi:hypothetical protein
MKTTPIFLISFLIAKSAFAWSGYDHNNKTQIEIGEGNLVREGLTIQFYDAKIDNYHNAKVLFMNSIAGGTEIQVKDLDSGEERRFIMMDN